ncbi:MAG: caspase family protein [Gemmataceae bacterium]
MNRFPSLIALLFLAEVSFAQQADRRARDEPEIVVEAGGRVGPADALLFTPDGKHLLAGGDDKVVRVWPHDEKGLGKASVLRWRAWREQRGGIKAVAVSPDGQRVAVGGYGMRPSTVCLLDRETGDVLGLTWPLSKPGENIGAVMAVAYHPDGKRIAFGTADGRLWLWEPEKLAVPDKDGRPSKPPQAIGSHTPNGEFNFPRSLSFTGPNALVSVAQSGEVIESDLAKSKPLFNAIMGQGGVTVHRAEASGGRLAIATSGPRVLLRGADGKLLRSIELTKDSFPHSLALSKDGKKLAVGVATARPAADGKPRFYLEENDHILLFDSPFEGNGEPKRIGHTGPAEAMAFHPSENRLAIAGGDADEVTLLDLAKPEKPLGTIRGAGRQIWSVSLSENGDTLGIRTVREAKSDDPNRRGTGEWAKFDLNRLTPSGDDSVRWVEPIASADGWMIEPESRFTWYAVGHGKRHRLELDRARDQAPTCFTFLPATDKRPTRLLVGHYYGASLFELTEAGAKQTKLFTGHAGETLSIAAAKDQTWFVTGGGDHTVAAWSLTDWPSHPALGSSFDIMDGNLEVTGVDTGSPGWEAGLRVGDTLDLLAVGGKLLFDRRPKHKETGTAEAALAALKSPQPRIELFFGWTSKGQPGRKESLTTVRQRPLWKWFPAFNDRGRLTDWVVWMWHGSYYHTKSAHGDRLIGWHVNHPEPGGRPEFYQLQQFEKHFHRLDAIEKLVATRDIGAAIREVRGNNPLPVSFSAYEPAPVAIGVGKTVLGEKGLPITVSAKPRGNNPDLLPERVELWLNDHRLEVWNSLDPKNPFEQKFQIDAAKFRTGENHLAVLTFNAAGGRAEAVRTVKNPKPADPVNLVGLSVGINDYSGYRKAGGARNFGDLASANRDAMAIARTFEGFRGSDKFFRQGELELRLDAKANRKQLLASLNAFAATAKPEDLLVVFFAGHGDLVLPGPKGGLIPNNIKPELIPKGQRGLAAGGGLFVLCCPEYSEKNAANTSLTAEELFDGLAKVNCRKVVLLDACHSGQASEANLLRRAAPNGQGPFVIASCDQSELAYEHPKLNHGVFSYAVLDALGDGFRNADRDSDGILTAEELFNHSSITVPSLVRQIGLKGKSQNPICFPRDPPKFPVVQK